ncbi:MAG: acetyl-CoA carboxylase biotin carboxyl carrier protein subunit [Deltaproteobacteria bacterium]|nr:acetyl-CoA carboxylase biotin carboxyl carrier protein subunit [Deltaproteobacteria bacterium]
MVPVEPATASDAPQPAAPAAASAPAPAAPAAAPAAVPGGNEVPVYSTFAGSVELTDIKVKVGDSVTKGQAVAEVEAMKATHDIKSLYEGTVVSIQAEIGDEVDSSKPILTIATKG